MQQVQPVLVSLDALPAGISAPDMSDLPHQIDYVLIIPGQGNPTKALPLTFRQPNTTFKTLLDRYLTASSYKVPNAKDYFFNLNNGSKVEANWSVKDLLKKLGREKMEGIVLTVESIEYIISSEDYDNECCVIQYYKSSVSNFMLKVEFTIAGNSLEAIYYKCNVSSYGKEIIQGIILQIKQQFGIKVLEFSSIEQNYFNDEKGEKINLNIHGSLANQKIYNGDCLKIKFRNPQKIVVKRVVQKKFNSWIIIYKEGETQPLKLRYDQIYHMTFGELYKEKLQVKGAQKKKDAIYCLKVMDKIVKPLDLMSSVQIYFVNNETKPIEVVGKVVNEKMIFFKVIPSLIEKFNEFSLDELQIPKHQDQIRNTCRKLTKERAQQSKLQYFKKEQHVEPILIYTSELKYTDKTAKQPEKIYVSLNKYLRETPVLSLDEPTLNKEWRLRYASTLLKHLDKVQKYSGVTWRGVSYNPNIKKEDIDKVFTFKQFTSSSKNQASAMGFSEPDECGSCNLFRFNVKTGRSVIDYSQFKSQGQILLQPHTEFKLTRIEELKKDGKNFKIYHLDEQQTSKELPGTKANFIVWIDDKTGQNKQIYEQIQIPLDTTIFEQITSTDNLQKWLQANKRLFKDDTAKIIFITNMTRKQGNKLNETAGIDGVKLIRKVTEQLSIKEFPIFFFIGNLQATNNKLAKSKLSLNNIYVGNQTSEIQEYLNKQLAKK